MAERSRTDDSGGPDRFEGEELKVHQRRRELFLELARSESHRFAVIDGAKEPAEVETAIRNAVQETFAGDLNEGGASGVTAEGAH